MMEMEKEFPHTYIICDVPDSKLFKKQCEAIEKHIPGLEADKILDDVDGSSYQTYHHANGDIEVCNDYRYGDLYVQADFDLLPYFPQKK